MMICWTVEHQVATQYAPVAQLDRALDSDSKGRRFEFCRAYQQVGPAPNSRLRETPEARFFV